MGSKKRCTGPQPSSPPPGSFPLQLTEPVTEVRGKRGSQTAKPAYPQPPSSASTGVCHPLSCLGGILDPIEINGSFVIEFNGARISPLASTYSREDLDFEGCVYPKEPHNKGPGTPMILLPRRKGWVSPARIGTRKSPFNSAHAIHLFPCAAMDFPLYVQGQDQPLHAIERQPGKLPASEFPRKGIISLK